MALSDVKFYKGKGGLGRPLIGEDHISGLVFYTATLPAGFSTSDRIKIIYSLEQAEDLGIAEGSANYGVMHYHISEYFRIQPKGELYLGLYAVPGGAYDFAELKLVRDYAEGKIRQMGVHVTSVAFATSQVTSLQAVFTDSFNAHKPFEIIYAPDISGTADVATLPDLRLLTAPNVSVVIGQDAGAVGAGLFDTVDKSISCLGACLGAVSLAKVNENIGWPGKFDMAGNELDVIAFSNGQLIRALADTALAAVDTKGYIFLRKHTGKSGSFFNYSHTAVATTSDYATIENNRVMHKAIRGIRSVMVPELNSPLYLQADGKLRPDTVSYFESLCNRPIEQMEKEGEISARKVLIDPDQDVLGTNDLVITIQEVPVGVARNININIGYVKKIA